MHRAIVAPFLLVAAACSGPAAGKYDSSDPISCLTIFSLTSNGAVQRGDIRLAKEMNAQMARLASQHGGAGWIKEVSPRAIEFGEILEKDKDHEALVELLDECRRAPKSG